MRKLKWKLTGLYTLLLALSLCIAIIGIAWSNPVRWANLPLILGVAVLPTILAAYYFFSGLSRRIQKLNEDTKALVSTHNADDKAEGDELTVLGDNIYRVTSKYQDTILEVSRESSKMAAILASMLEGIVSLDQRGSVVLLNRSAGIMLGLDESEAIGKYFNQFLRDLKLEEQINKVLQEAVESRYEFDFAGRRLRILMSPVLAGNSVQGAVLLLQDITEIRKLEKLRTEFVANVSHELRTPLTSIKGFVETLLDGADQDAVVRQRFLKIIHDETGRLQRLIEDLLTMSYLENRPQTEGETAFTAAAYDKVAEVLTSLAKAKNIELVADIPNNMPAASIGPELLSQLFVNLMENGIKYTPAGGKVWLKVITRANWVVLQVGDTGPGIPQESLPRIFERFYRVDKARSREMGGTGLGLSIVKHIVEQANGKLQVESELGKGTLFTIYLPQVAKKID